MISAQLRLKEPIILGIGDIRVSQSLSLLSPGLLRLFPTEKKYWSEGMGAIFIPQLKKNDVISTCKLF